jgi:hypothetical protein
VQTKSAEPQVHERGMLSDYFDDVADIVRYDLGLVGKGVTGALGAAPRLLFDAVRRPLRTAASAGELAASVYRFVRPLTETGSPLMKERTLVRRLAVHEVPLATLKEAGHRSGGALNDAFVAGISGGLRRYHEQHGVTVGDLHLTMPISIRKEGDDMGGNHITLARFDVPVGVADPAERISETHERTTKARNERSTPYVQLIAGAMNLMPRWYIGSVLRKVDFLASDVPGVPVPVYLGGAKVTVQYAFGPTIGSAVNVTLLRVTDSLGEDDGGNGVDLLVNIENLAFGDRWVTLEVAQSFVDIDGDGTPDAVSLRGTDGADTLVATALNARMEGGAGNDSITGAAGDDILIGGQGNDALNGGAGRDIGEYSQSLSSYTITQTADGYQVQANSNTGDGTDTLVGMEGLQFTDAFVSLIVAMTGRTSMAMASRTWCASAALTWWPISSMPSITRQGAPAWRCNSRAAAATMH